MTEFVAGRDADLMHLVVACCDVYSSDTWDRIQRLARLCREARDERDARDAARYAPGEWECPTCRYTLQKSYLHAASGGVSVNNEAVREVCPNDGATLRRVTWEALARMNQEIGMEEMRRVREVQAQLAAANADKEILRQNVRDLANALEEARNGGAP